MRILSILTFDNEQLRPPSEEDIERMGGFVAELKARGALIDTGGVMPGMLELTYRRKNGKDTVTDGPFTESKEVVGGYALLEVRDRDEAIALTREFLDYVGDATCTIHEVSSA